MGKKKQILVWSLLLLSAISGLIIYKWELHKMPFGHELMYVPVFIDVLVFYLVDKKVGNYFVIFLIVFFIVLFLVANFF